MRAFDALLALLRYEMFEEDLPEDLLENITPQLLTSVYNLAAKQDIAHLIGDAVDRLSISDADGTVKKMVRSRDMAVYRYSQIRYELQLLREAFESECIDFIPLKGSVIRDLYPKPWMRTSCDIDVFVRVEDLERARDVLVDKYGYKAEEKIYTTHDISLYSSSGVHLELHYDLLDEGDRRGEEIVNEIWRYTYRVQGSRYHYAMKDDAFYFYHILHMAKHFQVGGCGVRFFLDLWLLNHKASFDKDKREDMLFRTGFLKFANAMERLSECWFSGDAPDNFTLQLEEYILNGGLYGGVDNRVAIQQTKAGGRLKYIWLRIFISSSSLKRKYPILEKRPYLIPIYHVKRWFSPIFNRGAKSRSMKEIAISNEVYKNSDATERMLKELGI